MENNSSFELYKMISNLVQRKSYAELEQLLIANKPIITIPILNELLELPLHDSIVNAHRNLYSTIVEVADINKAQLTLRHSIQVASIKLAIEKLT